MKIERINPDFRFNPVNKVQKSKVEDVYKDMNVAANSVQNYVVTGKGSKIKIQGIDDEVDSVAYSDPQETIDQLDPEVKGFQHLQEHPESIVRDNDAISYFGGMIKTDGSV